MEAEAASEAGASTEAQAASMEAEAASMEAEVDSTRGLADFTERASVASTVPSAVLPPCPQLWLHTPPSALLPSSLRWWVLTLLAAASFAPAIASTTDSLPVAFTTDDFSARPSIAILIRMITDTIMVTPTMPIRDIAT
jgi:hypothetical protein